MPGRPRPALFVASPARAPGSDEPEAAAAKRALRARLLGAHRFLGSSREAPAASIALAALLFGGVLIASHDLTSVTAAIDVLFLATDGWISALLVYPAVALGLVWIAITRCGKLRARDVGWRASALLPALGATGFVWLGADGSLRLLEHLRGSVPEPTWAWRGQASVVGALFSQLLGNALAEETLMRGLLLPQVYLRLSRVAPRATALAGAVVLNGALAIAYHVPAYSRSASGGELVEALAFVFWFSVLLCAVFVVTRNLFACVGLHALWNVRPATFEVAWHRQDAAWWGWTALLVVLCLLREPSRRRLRDRPRS